MPLQRPLNHREGAVHPLTRILILLAFLPLPKPRVYRQGEPENTSVSAGIRLHSPVILNTLPRCIIRKEACRFQFESKSKRMLDPFGKDPAFSHTPVTVVAFVGYLGTCFVCCEGHVEAKRAQSLQQSRI
jgi:hypothetical protein